MKKKSASQSAFFNLRVLIGLFIVLAGVFLALAGLGTFSAITASSAQAQQKYKIIDVPGLPPGFDCSRIHDLGIDKMDNLRAGLIMIACGEGGSASATSPLAAVDQAVDQAIQKWSAPLNPLTYGGADVDLITGTETPPHIIQSETFSTANPDNPNEIGVAYNDSRGCCTNISGASFSTDGGATFTRLTPSPFANTFGDPVLLYNKPTATWYTVWIDGGCGGGGLGGYKSTTPENPASWTHYCVHTGGSDDRESGWADNNTASPHYGNMYVSWNNFAVGGGALQVAKSTDNGVTWSSPVTVVGSFIRDVQITGDLVTGDVYIAGMDEMGGGLTNRANKIYRSTDGGNTWTNTYTGPTFAGPGRGTCFSNAYFAAMFGNGFWRHMGWGEPAAYNHVVHYVYAARNTGNGDPGDVFYIRSTDSGVTFSAPFQLNTDTDHTKAQWQPNLSVSPAGTLLATWYDERQGTSCIEGNPNALCYGMWANKSANNGVTWQGDMAFSDVVSPLPGQSDPNIVGCYAGDYDYGSAILTKHVTSWVDGRVIIPPVTGQSQQDAFTDRELVGFAVTTTVPACNSVINTQPTSFIVNLSDPALASSVQASDFTVNGIPANSFMLSNGNATITFTFNSTPVTMQGVQTMHIPAGAILRNSDSMPIFDFTCTFCYALTPLQVTTTVPPVGGTFSPPAPGDYQYDVNFNQAVDQASVQTSDLTLTGNAGGSVTSVMLINGNTTARFMLHFNFGGSVTAHIAAGAITAEGCNGNAEFTGNYTVQTTVLSAFSRKAHGAGGPCQFRVLIAYADIGGQPTMLQNEIQAEPGVTVVDLFDAFNGTPTLAQLQQYDIVFAFSNNFWNNAVAMGDVLADYEDGGGIVVVGTFAWDSRGGWNLAGRWMTGGYTPYNSTAQTNFSNNTANITNPGHPLMQGVISLSAFYRNGVTLTSGAASVANWTDVPPAVAYKANNGHTAVGINAYLGYLDQFSGEWGRVIVNAGRWLHASCAPNFDIPLPLTGNVGIECRTGPTYQMIINFANPVTVGSAMVTSGTGHVTNFSGNGTPQITVNLDSVTDVQRITVTLMNVTDGISDVPATDVPVPMGVLIGDVNGSTGVNSTDVALTKSKVGQTVDMSNFREDVNASGTITATDVTIVKSDVGHALPP